MTLKLTPEQLAYRLQFAHIEKLIASWPGASEEMNLALIFGVSMDDYRRIKTSFTANALRAAEELVSDASFAARVRRLPFAKNSVVVALGDSITDDWQSWFEILRHVLAMCCPHDGVQLVNAGISGDTTAQMITRFLSVVNYKPNWILCFAGTNDAKLIGAKPIKTLVGIEETAGNLKALRALAATQIPAAQWNWITPATVDEHAIATHWFIGQQEQLRWRNADLAAIADAMKGQPDPVVDLQSAFGNPARSNYLLDDGLHPSLDGQKAILRALIEKLT